MARPNAPSSSCVKLASFERVQGVEGDTARAGACTGGLEPSSRPTMRDDDEEAVDHECM